MAANRLAGEVSPYLLQHAHNPVDWRPWGGQAFEEARRRDMPLFLSIGYSTCHWCHVMERESFEDEEVAQALNRAFVCVKVDREERPEVDAAYMDACHLMSGRGGWPLTVLATPDGLPFFAATYLPPRSRFGTPGVTTLAEQSALLWKENRQTLLATAKTLSDRLAGLAPVAEPGWFPGPEVSDMAFAGLQSRFDRERGGFGTAPKFPSPHVLLFLLARHRRTGDAAALSMVEATLRAMAAGGLRDHLGGGFHRYSTDERWLLPHFEKMLYDQAMLSMAYAQAFAATGEALYADLAGEVLSYVGRDLTGPEGQVFCAEDADSEGEEGRFYVWTAAELREVLPPDLIRPFFLAYGVEEAGNVAEESSGRKTGANVLHLPRPLEESARLLELTPQETSRLLAVARSVLRDVRGRRVRPLRDDKVLADGGGLFAAALGRCARLLSRPDLAEAGRKAALYALDRFADETGLHGRSFRAGQVRGQGLLDDHAFLAWGLLELHAAAPDPDLVRRAEVLGRALLARFEDQTSGGFFQTPADGETVLFRRKDFFDGAVPSGNAAAFLALTLLGRATGDAEFTRAARRIPGAFAQALRVEPSGCCMLLAALEEYA